MLNRSGSLRLGRLGLIAGSVGILLCASVALADIVSGSFATGSSRDVTYSKLTINTPASVAAGDLLLANVAVNGGTAAVVTAPAGWTQVLRTDNDSNVSIISYSKIASSSEPSNFTWTIDHQTTAEGGITRYSGVDTSNPIDVSAGSTGFGKVATAPAVVTSAANEELVTFFAADAGRDMGRDMGRRNGAGTYFGTPSGMTEKYDVANVPFGPSTASDDKVQVTSGNSGSKSSTVEGGKKVNWVAQTIALRKRQSVSSNTASIQLQATSTQYLEALDSPSLSVTGNLTVETWVKFASLPAYNPGQTSAQTIYSKKGSGYGVDSYEMFINQCGTTCTMVIQFADGLGTITSFTPQWNPSVNTWYHLAVVYDTSGTAKFYVNGNLIDSKSGLVTHLGDTNSVFRIGQDTDGNGFLDGNIDDFRVYNIARTQSEIQSDMSSELAGNETGLVAYWKFSNNFLDATANHNNLTNAHGAQFSTSVPF